MSDCRICFRNSNERLLKPCMCKGSIGHIHEACLVKWLKNKYPASFKSLMKFSKSDGIGMRCEICDYEYKGKVCYLNLFQIINKVMTNKISYCIVANIPILLYLVYKCNRNFQDLYKIASEFINLFKVYRKFLDIIMPALKINFKLISKLFLLAGYSVSTFLIMNNTLRLLSKLKSESKMIHISDNII